MGFNLRELITVEEDASLQELSEALVKEINEKVTKKIKKLNLKKKLNVFDIEVVGLSLQVTVKEEYIAEVTEREKIKKINTTDIMPDYMV